MFLRQPPRQLRDPEKFALLQWHLTSRCEGNCRFCYMLDSPTYESELKNELGLEKCRKIIRNFSQYLKKNGFLGRVHLTGGDPLLREDFWEILAALGSAGVEAGVMGNHHLINSKTADRLRRNGVKFFQLSIDGLKKTHDYFRGAGSFEKTWAAARVLREHDISVTISLTLSQRNVSELPELVKMCYQNKINSFRPARLVPEGRGEDFARDLLTPGEYKEALFKVLRRIMAMSARGGHFLSYPVCDPLTISLITGIEGNYLPLNLKGFFANAVGIGCHGRFLTLLPDGTAYLCRRLPIRIGSILENSFEELYESELSCRLRDPRSYRKCSACDLAALCRGGCPAVTYAVTGDPFGKDPQCWVEPCIDSSTPRLRRVAQDDRKVPGITIRSVQGSNEKNGLFQPLKIGSLETGNRIFRSATLEGVAAPDGGPTEEHLRIYRELVSGGCGLIITGITYVSEDAKINIRQNGIHRDFLAERWKGLTDEIHRIGGKIAVQLTHQSAGVLPQNGELIGPSAMRYGGLTAREMSEREIVAAIDDFQQAILRAERAGFDAVQLQIAHGYLLDQFFSPLTNRRTDRWGGSLENRLRIVVEILRGVKGKLAKNYPLMAKIDCSDAREGGLTTEETSEAVGVLSREGVAAFELSGRAPTRTGAALSAGENEGYFQKEGEFIRKNNPDAILGICGGIRSRQKMEELLNRGFDFISLSRPFIREPDLVNKFKKDPQYQPQCVSCSVCFLKIKRYPLKCHLVMEQGTWNT